MPVQLRWNRDTKRCVVTVDFQSDARMDKPGLEDPAIAHGLLETASLLCADAARQRLAGGDQALEAERVRLKDEVDAAIDARKRAAVDERFDGARPVVRP